jgi:hypothetical protein
MAHEGHSLEHQWLTLLIAGSSDRMKVQDRRLISADDGFDAPKKPLHQPLKRVTRGTEYKFFNGNPASYAQTTLKTYDQQEMTVVF